MSGWRRLGLYGLSLLLVTSGVLLWDLADAGAVTVSTVPWYSYTVSPDGQNAYGNCNELFVTPLGGVTAGYAVQVACQTMVKASDTLSIVAPVIPTSAYSCSSSSGWSTHTGSWWYEPMIDNPGCGQVPTINGSSDSSCAAPLDGSEGPNIYLSSRGGGVWCTYNELPETVPGGSSWGGGAFAWDMYGHVDSATGDRATRSAGLRGVLCRLNRRGLLLRQLRMGVTFRRCRRLCLRCPIRVRLAATVFTRIHRLLLTIFR